MTETQHQETRAPVPSIIGRQEPGPLEDDDAQVMEDAVSDGKTSWKQYLTRGACLFFSILCGFTNGYDICVTSAILDSIVADFHLCAAAESVQPTTDANVQPKTDATEVTSCPDKELILSLYGMGSMLAKISLGWIADRYGRRFALGMVDVFLIFAVILMTWANTPMELYAGRFTMGIGTGLAFIVQPAYVAEIAPSEHRGKYVVLNEVAVCVGCLLGLQLSVILLHGKMYSSSWRLAVTLAACPPLLQLCFLVWLPESPRYLARKKDEVRLADVANRLGLPRREVETLLEACQQGDSDTLVHAEEKHDNSGFTSCVCQWFREQSDAWHEHRRAILIAFAFSTFTAISGMYALQAFAVDILQEGGIEQPMGLLPLVGWFKLFGAVCAMGLADQPAVGRRRLAIVGSAFCAVSDVLLAARLRFPSSTPVWVSPVALFSFIFSWNVGFGALQFLAIMELLPTKLRSVWSGRVLFMQGLAESASYQLFEACMLASGPVTFTILAAVNVLASVFVACFLPELSGCSLEDQDQQRPAGLQPTGLSQVTSQTLTATSMVVANAATVRRYGILHESGEDMSESPDTMRRVVQADGNENTVGRCE